MQRVYFFWENAMVNIAMRSIVFVVAFAATGFCTDQPNILEKVDSRSKEKSIGASGLPSPSQSVDIDSANIDRSSEPSPSTTSLKGAGLIDDSSTSIVDLPEFFSRFEYDYEETEPSDENPESQLQETQPLATVATQQKDTLGGIVDLWCEKIDAAWTQIKKVMDGKKMLFLTKENAFQIIDALKQNMDFDLLNVAIVEIATQLVAGNKNAELIPMFCECVNRDALREQVKGLCCTPDGVFNINLFQRNRLAVIERLSVDNRLFKLENVNGQYNSGDASYDAVVLSAEHALTPECKGF
jgi:hypothetical protein